MLELTSLDYVYVGVILVSTIWATVRGGIYETIATVSWVVAAISARFASPTLDKLFQQWFGLSESTIGTLVAAYFIVFFVILLILGFINQKLRDKIQESMINATDKTLGIIFGIIRGIIVMGAVYWGILWYYSDAPFMPNWASEARTRPIMQLTAIKLDEWFIPGEESKLLQRDMTGAKEALEIYNNLISPAVVDKAKKTSEESSEEVQEETGYKSSERTALENQLLQIETAAKVQEQIEANPELEIVE